MSGLTYDQEDAAIMLRQRAWSLERIAAVLDCSAMTISRVMSDKGVVAPRQRKVRRAPRRA